MPETKPANRYAVPVTPPPTPSSPSGHTLLQRADAWATQHDWAPRLAPLLVWLVFVMLARVVGEGTPLGLPWVYGAQILVTGGLLWRWRRFFPEMNARFDWASAPLALLVLVAWLALGWLGRGSWNAATQSLANGQPMPGGSPLAGLVAERPPLGWTILGLRLLGMTLVVPCIEELFFRSAIPRAVPSWRALGRRILQLVADWPGLGPPAHRALQTATWQIPPARRPGHWSWAGVVTSTALFVLNHHQADWAGAAVAGLLWCGLAASTNRHGPGKGLGPVIWSHALANAGLWFWCVARGDWSFL